MATIKKLKKLQEGALIRFKRENLKFFSIEKLGSLYVVDVYSRKSGRVKIFGKENIRKIKIPKKIGKYYITYNYWENYMR